MRPLTNSTENDVLFSNHARRIAQVNTSEWMRSTVTGSNPQPSESRWIRGVKRPMFRLGVVAVTGAGLASQVAQLW